MPSENNYHDMGINVSRCPINYLVSIYFFDKFQLIAIVYFSQSLLNVWISLQIYPCDNGNFNCRLEAWLREMK